MYLNNDFIYDATIRFEEITGIPVEVKSINKEYDALITIKGIQFVAEVKAEIRNSNKGIILSELNHIKNKIRKPIIVIAKYLAADIAKEFKNLCINYMDIAGNAYIKEDDLFVFTSGQKAEKISRTNQSRAFQEAGVKLIFILLKNPENLQCTYRELAAMTNISIGSVSNIMKELEELNYILITNTKRVLKNIPSLLNRWIIAYNEVLRPRIIRKRMRFSNIEDYKIWDTIPLQNIEGINIWGGEPAATLLTGQLQPEKFMIYTNTNWQSVASKLKLIPDEKGDVEILYMFWKDNDINKKKNIAPALLIYAELIASGHERNLQIAKTILENELQHIK
ncbi:MAG: winged helix-turn-helix transcriptional regulator [Bacteroidales bacterium]|nr:winged helix-turn-helix transcriptional regulator [Bacteroidales bacterium]